MRSLGQFLIFYFKNAITKKHFFYQYRLKVDLVLYTYVIRIHLLKGDNKKMLGFNTFINLVKSTFPP